MRTPVDKKLFDLIVESTVEGKMKPDIEIYEVFIITHYQSRNDGGIVHFEMTIDRCIV